MSDRESLTRSLYSTVGLLATFQVFLSLLTILLLSIPFYGFVLFLVVSIPFHGLLLYLLLRRRHQFILTDNDEPLERINIPNALSLFRLSSAPTILFFLIVVKSTGKLFVVIPFIVVVFSSDLLDGYLARRLNQVTLIGKYLDSSTDYFILFCISIALLVFDLLPLWFFILLLGRLLLMTLGVIYVYLKQGFVEPESSYLGRASICAVMIVFALKVLQLIMQDASLSFPWQDALLSVIEKLLYMAAGIVIASCFEKFRLLRRKIRSIKKDGPHCCKGGRNEQSRVLYP
jgi:cardiolipin synthase